MSRLSVALLASKRQRDREKRDSAWAKRLRAQNAILCVLALGLVAWMVGAAMAPSTGIVQRTLLLIIAVLVPLHILFWQAQGLKILDRVRHWPRPLGVPVALLAIAASPMALYPLGAIAILVSLFSSGGTAPALAVIGAILLSPIIYISFVAIVFVLSGSKGG